MQENYVFILFRLDFDWLTNYSISTALCKCPDMVTSALRFICTRLSEQSARTSSSLPPLLTAITIWSALVTYALGELSHKAATIFTTRTSLGRDIINHVFELSKANSVSQYKLYRLWRRYRSIRIFRRRWARVSNGRNQAERNNGIRVSTSGRRSLHSLSGEARPGREEPQTTPTGASS